MNEPPEVCTLAELADLTNRLHALLESPEAGLMTWHSMFTAAAQDLVNQLGRAGIKATPDPELESGMTERQHHEHTRLFLNYRYASMLTISNAIDGFHLMKEFLAIDGATPEDWERIIQHATRLDEDINIDFSGAKRRFNETAQ